MLNWISHIHFLAPVYFWLFIPLIILLLYMVLRNQLKKKLEGKQIIAPHLAKILLTKEKKHKNNLPIITIAVMLCTLIVILTQPVWQKVNKSTENSTPLIIVMDASLSMQKSDISPTRYKRSVFFINRLLKSGINRPVSILALSGSTHILIPPSTDLELVSLYLSYLSPDIMPIDGGDADELVKRIKATPVLNAQQAAILLITDGIENGLPSLKSLIKENNIDAIALTLTDFGKQTATELAIKSIDELDLSSNNTKLIDAVAGLSLGNNNSGTEWQDESFYPLLIITLALLLWFRKGWTVHWSFAVALCFFIPSSPIQASMADWFLTKDQQGMIYIYLGEYKKAKDMIISPEWKAVACYYDEDFKCAQKEFSKVGDIDAIFNMANSAAQDGRYKTSRELYQALLSMEPNYPGAKHNLNIIVKIIEEINQLSKSDGDNKPPSKGAKSPPKDASEIADGGNKKMYGSVPLSTLKASDILKSESATDQWLRDISRDPRKFIRLKFLLEYNRENSEG